MRTYSNGTCISPLFWGRGIFLRFVHFHKLVRHIVLTYFYYLATSRHFPRTVFFPFIVFFLNLLFLYFFFFFFLFLLHFFSWLPGENQEAPDLFFRIYLALLYFCYFVILFFSSPLYLPHSLPSTFSSLFPPSLILVPLFFSSHYPRVIFLSVFSLFSPPGLVCIANVPCLYLLYGNKLNSSPLSLKEGVFSCSPVQVCPKKYLEFSYKMFPGLCPTFLYLTCTTVNKTFMQT
jgi:hypothetical protein